MPRLAVLLLLLASLQAVAAPGDADPTFGINGTAQLDFAERRPIDIRAASGLNVVGTIARVNGTGRQIVLGRVNDQGMMDPTFGQGGWIPLDDPTVDRDPNPVALAIDAAGQFVVVCTTDTGLRLVVARPYLNGGVFYFTDEFAGAYPQFAVRAMAIQPDGKIVIAGSYNGNGQRKIFVHRYGTGFSDLWPDQTFGSLGRMTFGPAAYNVEAYGVAIAPTDGAIFVAGSIGTGTGTDASVARLAASGALDPGFGQSGIAAIHYMGGNDAALAILVDGSRVIAGGRADLQGQGRFLAWSLDGVSGISDPNFGTNGLLVLDMPVAAAGDSDARVKSLRIDSAARVVLSGTVKRISDGNGDFGFARVSDHGTPDVTFGDCTGGVCGKYVGPPAADFDELLSIAVGSQGDFFALGRNGESIGTALVVSHHAASGAADPGFGSNGRATYPWPYVPSVQLQSVALQADGSMVAFGQDGIGGRVARFTSAGVLDSQFGTGGSVPVPGVDFFGTVAIQPDNKIIVAGGSFPARAWRLNPNGAFDPTWQGGGAASFAPSNNLRSMDLQADGKVVASLVRITSTGANQIVVSRLNSDGTTDTTFGTAGEVAIALGSGVYEQDSTTLRVLPDGRILVGGSTRLLPATQTNIRYTMTLIRLLSSGALDPTWGSNGIGQADIGDFAVLHDFAVASDGRVIAAGACRYPDWNTCLARFTAGGVLDTSFGANGFVDYNLSYGDSAATLNLDSAGRMIVGANVIEGAALRLLPGGSLDTSFGTNGRVDIFGWVADALVQPDDRIVIATSDSSSWYLTRLLGGGPPETTLSVTPSVSPTSQTTATATFTASTAGSTFQCSLDAAPFAVCTSPVNLTALADGTHTFQVRAIDPTGAMDPTPAVYSWIVDTVAPETAITAGPSGTVASTAATFSFTATETGSTFQCRVDGAPFASCTSPKSLSGLAQGSHTFEVRATDAAGNVDASPASRTWTVDTVPPDTTVAISPTASPTAQTSATLTFTATETGSTFECKLDAAAFAACTSPVNLAGLADGSHTFQVRAIDVAGNIDATPASATWVVDTVAPDTSIVSGPSGPTAANQATFESSSTESPAVFECRLDGGAWSSCASSVTYTALSDGSHSFDVRAIDAAGNTDATPASRTWIVDTVAPDTIITSGPTGTLASTSATFSFVATETGSTFDCRLDGAAFAACASPMSYSGLSQGSHTFDVRAIDLAGNVDPTPASRSWSVDTTPPDLTISGGPSGTVSSTSASFTLGSSDPSATFECRLDAAGFATCPSATSYSGLAEGTHTFDARARDAAGNLSAVQSRAWTVDITPPDTSFMRTPPAATNATVAQFDWAASETGVTYQYRLDGEPWISTTGTTKIYDVLTVSTHTFDVRAIDAAGNIDPSPATWTWTIDQTGPHSTITSAPPSPTTSTSATFTFSCDETGCTFLCSVDAAPMVACTSPITYSGLADGQRKFNLLARDAAGNWEQQGPYWIWTIDTSAPDTTITAGPSGTVTTTSATFTFTSPDPAATFECSLDAVAFTACSSGITYTNLAQGMHMFEVRARDPAGNVDATPASSTWSVDSLAPNTTITSGPSAVTNSTSATLVFTSTEPGTFQCKLDAAAYSACASPVNFVSLGAGSHTFSVYAVDSAGNADASPATWSWAIDLTTPETTISSGPSGSVAQNTATFAFTSSESGSTFECHLDGAAFASCASPVSYAGLAEGAHSFEVRAIDAAGNVDPTPAARTWTVDTIAPDTTISAAPPAITNATAASFSFGSNESGSSFNCKLDAGAYAACTSPKAYSALAAGSHTFSVFATDAAGNVDASPASFTWTIDTTPPDTTITAGPSGNNNTSTATFSFTSTEAGSTFQCKLDAGAFAACSSPTTYSGLAKGSHTFQVRAIDAAGNVDATPASRTWSVK